MKLRYFFILFGMYFIVVGAAVKPATRLLNELKISGQITQTNAYCGGAAPTEEMEKEFRKKHPLPGRKLYLRAGIQNDVSKPLVAETVSNALGGFEFDVPAGSYCLITEEKFEAKEHKAPEQWGVRFQGEACLKEWMQACDQVIIVTDRSVSHLEINKYQRCFIQTDNPCYAWDGPMPP
jgi:hypothetical protein